MLFLTILRHAAKRDASTGYKIPLYSQLKSYPQFYSQLKKSMPVISRIVAFNDYVFIYFMYETVRENNHYN